MSICSRRSQGRIVPLLIAISVVACGDDGTTPPADECDPGAAGEVEFVPEGPVQFLRLGGGTFVEAEFTDGCGQVVAVGEDDAEWASSDPSVVTVSPLTNASPPRVFVQAEDFGSAEVSATFGPTSGSIAVEVLDIGADLSGFTILGLGEVHRSTTDLWVHGDVAYTGSQDFGCGDCTGSWLYIWRLQGDAGIAPIDSLSLPTRRINDVKVAEDGSFGVATMEAGESGENGIAMLDLADPAAPVVLTRYLTGLEGGVHNVWIERIDERDYVFAVEETGEEDAGVHVLDVTDPAAPEEVALFHAGSSFPHDVYVRDGLAFVSHWNAGLVILDVGNGIMEGSPGNPVEVGRVVTDGGHVHNAWYWPERELVFVGEESFPPPDRIDEVGVLHVVDVSDLTTPMEVASYGVPGATPHNFWLDEENEILFAAWYTNGLRALDVSGALSGDLTGQGIELGHVIPSGFNGLGSIWAPQLHQGLVYMSDVFHGIWSVRFDG